MNNVKKSWLHLFIDHPKWAVSWCALLCAFGLQSGLGLQVRQFPAIPSGMIRLVATYPGADAELIQNSVTSVLQRAIGQADSFDYIQSSTSDGVCQIQAYLPMGADIDRAFPSVLAQIQSVKRNLPPDLNDPILTKARVSPLALMYIAYTTSENGQVTPSEIYHYLDTVIRPQLQTVDGVGELNILGTQSPALRVWVDHDRLGQYELTVTDLYSKIVNENQSWPGGWVEDHDLRYPLLLDTQSHRIEDLADIIIKMDAQGIVRLRDVADIEIGAENYDAEALFNGKNGVFLSVDTLPNANALTVIAAVKDKLKKLEPGIPPQLHQEIVYDASVFIHDSVYEVLRTIIEASLIVVVMIYAFLKSLKAVFIPVVAIPLSLIGVMIFMSIFGMSVNLLTLLAMMLSIGLVVDDAILIVEHTVHWREKYPQWTPIDTAKAALSSLALPLMIMTMILAVAYLPLAMLQGLTGSLFREFALTLSGAVILSGFVALVVSPVLCAYAFSDRSLVKVQWVENLSLNYVALLEIVMREKSKILKFCMTLPFFLWIFSTHLPSELAPKEDQGFTLLSYRGPQIASLNYTRTHAEDFGKLFRDIPEIQDSFYIHGAGGFGVSSGLAGFIMKPWSQRKKSTELLLRDITHRANEFIPLEVYAFTPASLPGPDGLEVQWVIYGPQDLKTLTQKADALVQELKKTGYFAFLTTDLKMNKLNQHMTFDREALFSNQLTSSVVAQNHLLNLTDARSSYYRYDAQQIDLILRQKNRDFRKIQHELPIGRGADGVFTNDDCSQTYYRESPNAIFQFNQMNSITIQGVLFPIATLGDVIHQTESYRDQLIEDGYFMDYTGPSRSYIQEHGKLLMVGLGAIFIMYFLLLVLFESYLDPLLILLTIPLAITGALLVLNITQLIGMVEKLRAWGVSINIYTELALLTLLGLITKHGILLTDVAKQYRHEGLSIQEAAVRAAHERFRPILMTTLAMVVGVLPLLFATGAGAVSRYHLGLVIASGLALGTIFTLFCYPVLYTVAHEYFDQKEKK